MVFGLGHLVLLPRDIIKGAFKCHRHKLIDRFLDDTNGCGTVGQSLGQRFGRRQ